MAFFLDGINVFLVGGKKDRGVTSFMRFFSVGRCFFGGTLRRGFESELSSEYAFNHWHLMWQFTRLTVF